MKWLVSFQGHYLGGFAIVHAHTKEEVPDALRVFLQEEEELALLAKIDFTDLDIQQITGKDILIWDGDY
jgi:hypothetical protein